MMKRALVFGGGGAKGAYELGVWKAIKELKIKIDIVTGTSVGALNGAIFVTGEYDLAEKLWTNLSPNQVIKTEETDPKLVYAKFLKEIINGGADTTPLEDLLKLAIDERKVRNSKIKYGLITCSFPSLTPKALSIDDIEEGHLIDYLMASATAYPVFRPKLVNGNRFVDGGYYDNLPLNFAVNLGADEIIAVHLKAPGRYRILRNRTINANTIIPSRDLGSFLMFDKDLVKRNAQIGYLDTMKYFKGMDGELYSFYKDELVEKAKDLALSFSHLISKIFDAENSRLNEITSIYSARRVLKAFKSKHNRQYTPSITKLIQGIDCVGKVLNMDDLAVYKLKDFNNYVLGKVNESYEKYPECASDDLRLEDLGVDRLASDNQLFFALYIVNKIKQFNEGKMEASEAYPMFILYPEIALAALYIYCLLNFKEKKIKLPWKK